ncbi:anti-sigma factor family protein [Paraburkholderia susongensis]|uniref:Transmembrane transcriptional regulator (Anti-sigma factor RsiW) n=1 Tax=Paraburkholderia susongensis TaxID=1515439 RepID=A0A1X7JBH6_9BURK|nr:zf-HC2 domain-containing protein [Paraburkholderia susongensis]SMG25227.1 Transmembrane transcriptional regulator (anti-sigma factor RsiW) [Paraburkholderia susongensis]
MDCNEARPLLDANADHELPAPDARRVQQHIESCDDCRRASENLRALSGALRAAPYHRAPQSLRARVVAGLPAGLDEGLGEEGFGVPGATAGGAETGTGTAGTASAAGMTDAGGAERGHRRRGAWWLAWLGGRLGNSGGSNGSRGSGGSVGSAGSGGWGGSSGFGGPVTVGGANRAATRGGFAALVIALCAAAAVLTLSLHRPAEFAPFVDELVESHVRAQVSGRDIDVISTDQHTVKPWFNGRLDYSPPVEDLAASGFALEGGRLDYLAHQRVAVLVYRYRKHVIDVYVFPQSASGGSARGIDGAAPVSFDHDGYSIAHWDAAGMTWWAITDAAPDALSGLEAALRARLQSGSGRTEAG